MTDKLKITIGGKELQATVPFTIGQLQDLRVAVVLPPAADPAEEVKRDFKRSVDTLVAALQPEHPEITADSLMAMRTTPAELNKAVTDILEASGLVTKKDGAAGEAPAEMKAA